MAMAVGAALAVPVLLALYLLKLRRRPVRVSTVLFWPRASRDVQANVPLARPRFSWLLLLHAMLLALLLGAMGRPALRGGARPGGRVVLLVDASASMSARDVPGGPTRLERARRRALDIAADARKAGDNTQLAVASFALEPTLICGFTSARAVIASGIDAISPTDQPADLGAALRLVSGMGGQDSESAGPTTVVVIGDGAYAPSDEPVPGLGRLLFERIGYSGAGPPANLAIAGLGAARTPDDPTALNVQVRLASNAPSIRDAAVTLAWNGEAFGSSVVTLAPDPAGGAAGMAEFEVNRRDHGVLTAKVATDDALPADNIASLVVEAPRRPSILLVTPEAPSDVSNPGSLLLRAVLEEIAGDLLKLASGTEFDAAGIERRMTADLVVADRVALRALPAAATLSFGAAPASPGLAAGDMQPADAPAVLWTRKHPVLRHVTLDSLVIKRRLPLVLDRAGPWREIARTPDGPLMAEADAAGYRHLVVGFDLSASNWPVEVGFPVFVAATTDYLTLVAEAAAGRSFRTAEPIALRAQAREIVLDGPARLVLTGEPGGSLARGGPAPRAGVYESGGANPVRVAVNLFDERESSLASPDELKAVGRTVTASVGASSPREVWHWFVLAALGLLVVEWFVYARGVRV